MADKWFKDSNKRNSSFYAGEKNNIFRKLSITNWIIIFNVLIYLLVIVLINTLGEKVLYWFAITPNEFFNGAIWQALTSVFTHIWFPHLLFNMISLFFIGNFVERIIGRKRFFNFYLISGILASVFFAVLSFYFGMNGLGEKIFANPTQSAVGASGAIFALLGLMAVLTPKNKVYLVAGPLIALIIQTFLSYLYPNASFLSILNFVIVFYFFLSVFSIFSFNPVMRRIAFPIEMPLWLLPIVAIVPLVILGILFPLPIGNMAHLGGLLCGLAYGFYIKNKYKKKISMINKYFLRQS